MGLVLTMQDLSSCPLKPEHQPVSTASVLGVLTFRNYAAPPCNISN